MLRPIAIVTNREIITRQAYPLAPLLRFRSREPVAYVVVGRRGRKPGFFLLVVAQGTIRDDEAWRNEVRNRDGVRLVGDEEVSLQSSHETPETSG